MSSRLGYLTVFLSAAGAVALITPLIRWIAVRVGAIDQPSDRKIHPKPTPTIGGVAILVGALVGLGVAYLIPSFRAVFRESSELQGALFAALAITFVGLVDDVRTLSAPAKIAGQVLAAGILILNSVQLLFFWFPTQGVVSLGSDVAVPLTVLWVLVMVNAINLIDGLDGLAAGIVVIAASAFFAWLLLTPATFRSSSTTAAILSAIVAGAALGFLPYNVYPARIFMGDSGSMLLGVLLAAATISGVGRTIQPSRGDIAAFSIPVLIPAIVLAVPLADVALAIIRRMRKGRPVFAPDKEHIHHQLRKIGHTDRRAVFTMYFWSVLLAGAALAVALIHRRTTIALIVSAAAVLIAATLIPSRIRRLRTVRAATGEADATPATAAPDATKKVQGQQGA